MFTRNAVIKKPLPEPESRFGFKKSKISFSEENKETEKPKIKKTMNVSQGRFVGINRNK